MTLTTHKQRTEITHAALVNIWASLGEVERDFLERKHNLIISKMTSAYANLLPPSQPRTSFPAHLWSLHGLNFALVVAVVLQAAHCLLLTLGMLLRGSQQGGHGLAGQATFLMSSLFQPAHDPSTSPVSTPTSLTVVSVVEEASTAAPALQVL